MLDMIHGDVFEEDVSNHVVVTGYDGHTTLVVHLSFTLVHDTNTAERKILDGVNTAAVGAFRCCAMQADEDGVCDFRIEHTVFDKDVSR